MARMMAISVLVFPAHNQWPISFSLRVSLGWAEEMAAMAGRERIAMLPSHCRPGGMRTAEQEEAGERNLRDMGFDKPIIRWRKIQVVKSTETAGQTCSKS